MLCNDLWISANRFYCFMILGLCVRFRSAFYNARDMSVVKKTYRDLMEKSFNARDRQHTLSRDIINLAEKRKKDHFLLIDNILVSVID